MKETYLKIILALCIVVLLAMAVILPMSAATARPTKAFYETTVITEFNLRTWSTFYLEFDDYEGIPLNGSIPIQCNYTGIYDCIVVSEHKYNSTTSGLTHVKTRVFISDYNDPQMYDITNGVLTVHFYGDNASFDLGTGNYSIYFCPLGYLDNSFINQSIGYLSSIETLYYNENITTNFVSYWDNYTQRADRMAQGSYNILYRQLMIDIKNGDLNAYEQGKKAGKDIASEEWLQTENVLLNFISAIFTAPSHLINTIFNFNLFGYNVANLVKFLLTAVIVFFVFKIGLKGGAE